jgi:hypothetical protein
MIFSSAREINLLLKENILINQSRIPLDVETIETLCLGLNFLPSATTERNLLPAINRLIREINIRIHFYSKKVKAHKKGWLSKLVKSDWEPDAPTWLSDDRIPLIIEDLLEPKLNSNPITHAKIIQTIQKLNKRKDIHVLKSDKGRNTVIWEVEDYNREANRQLSDKETYLELSKEEFYSKLNTIKIECQEISENLLALHHITTEEDELICKRPLDGSSIYFLPKIHKPMNKNSMTFPGRPIVATFTSTTYLLDKYITELTKPLLGIIPGSLKNTADFLQRLPTETLPKNTKLTTADVVSLYPNIPWKEGIIAGTNFYENNFSFLRNDAITKRRLPIPSPKLFQRILSLVICSSVITFKKQRFFHQIKGTAMVCCISVYFANCYMFFLTQPLIEKPPPWLLVFLRFIDDIFIVSTSDNIKFIFDSISNKNIAYEINTPSVTQNFLDTTIMIRKGKILTKPYFKETASGSYTHPKSTHPRHIIRATPYSQLLRLRRISSNKSIFKNHSRKTRTDFLRMGYGLKLIGGIFSRIYEMEEEDLHPREKDKTIGKSFKLITQYHNDFDWSSVRTTLNHLHEIIIEHYSKEGPNRDVKLVEFLSSREISLIFSNPKGFFKSHTKHSFAQDNQDRGKHNSTTQWAPNSHTDHPNI